MTQTARSDDDVRERLAGGQLREAFELLVERYSTKVFHFAFSMLRNETQAEDMTQEILLRVWKGLPGYNGQASLSTWIYAISRNGCLSELKRRAARPTVSLEQPDFEDALERLPDLHATEREAGLEMDVNHLLGQLPEKYRQVLTLFYLEQKSYEQVSALLGIPLGTVKTFLYRAKRELMKISQRRSPALI